MEYWTIKQLADDQHVSYEAIRKQLVTHRKALEGHIVQKRQQKLLDEYAVDFLKKRRRESRVVTINLERVEEIDNLKSRLDQASIEIMTLQKQLLAYKERETKAIETAVRYEALLEDHKQTEIERDQARQELSEAKENLERTTLQLKLAEVDKERAEQEAQSFHKSIFGFYRKH